MQHEKQFLVLRKKLRFKHSTELLCSRKNVSLHCHASFSCCCMCFSVKQLARQTGLIHRIIYEEAITKCGPAAAAWPLFSLNLFSFALQRFLISKCIALSSLNKLVYGAGKM